MGTSRILFALTAVTAGAIAAGHAIPARSAADRDRGAPYWLDQTIYRPDCPGKEHGRIWHAEQICHAAASRQR